MQTDPGWEGVVCPELAAGIVQEMEGTDRPIDQVSAPCLPVPRYLAQEVIVQAKGEIGPQPCRQSRSLSVRELEAGTALAPGTALEPGIVPSSIDLMVYLAAAIDLALVTVLVAAIDLALETVLVPAIDLALETVLVPAIVLALVTVPVAAIALAVAIGLAQGMATVLAVAIGLAQGTATALAVATTSSTAPAAETRSSTVLVAAIRLSIAPAAATRSSTVRVAEILSSTVRIGP